MATLRKVEIKGFRSIKDATLKLESLNVFIGANGAGKSNFVAFFKMLNELIAGRLQEYVGKMGRAQQILHFGPKVTPELEGLLEFEVGESIDTYHLRFYRAPSDTLAFADETLDYKKEGWQCLSQKPMLLGTGHSESRIGDFAAQGNKTAKTIRHLLSTCRVYHFHDTSATARSRQAAYIHDNRWLMADGGNLAAMLYAYREKNETVYRRIVSTIRKVMREFDDFDLDPSRLNANDILLNWRRQGREDYLFGPDQISDGTLRAMSIITLLLQPEEDLPRVIILDEPELGLHPHALEIVAGLMRAASLKSQLIIATQSQTFLDFFEPEEIITVETIHGESVFQRLEQAESQEWLEDYTIGELWQRNVVGGGPLP